MPKFRKRPVDIEAWHTVAGLSEAPPWVNDAILKGKDFEGGIWGTNRDGGTLFVNTAEGPLRISHGDWIIRGIKGELYPCKPDIFEATYEPL
jgi:hypothetical protein